MCQMLEHVWKHNKDFYIFFYILWHAWIEIIGRLVHKKLHLSIYSQHFYTNVKTFFSLNFKNRLVTLVLTHLIRVIIWWCCMPYFFLFCRWAILNKEVVYLVDFKHSLLRHYGVYDTFGWIQWLTHWDRLFKKIYIYSICRPSNRFSLNNKAILMV